MEIVLLQLEEVLNKNFTIHNQNVMFNFNLVERYGVVTQTLKQAVRCYTEPFSKDVMLQFINDKENHHLGTIKY